MANKDDIDRTANILIFGQKLIEEIDELESSPIFRQSLKQRGKAFKEELEKTVNQVYAACDSAAVLQIIDVGNSIYGEISKLTIVEKQEFLKTLPDLIKQIKEPKLVNDGS